MTTTMTVREAALRYGAKKAWPHGTDKVVSSKRCAAFFATTIAVAPIERMAVLCLDARGVPVSWTLVALGGSEACAVTPGDMLRPVLLTPGCVSFLLAHNHPSGDPAPSESDVRLTERVRAGAELLGLRLLDHVIVTEDAACYYSFADRGLL